MLKAVLFDMDGVIVNTEPLHRKAYFQMFEEVGLDVIPDYYDGFTGQSTMEICRALCSRFELDRKPEELLNIKRKHFKHLFENSDGLKLIDGVLDLIKDYHQKGMTLILASSASMSNIDRIFDRFDLNPFFKAKISGADLKASKPHPEIFIKAAELAGADRDECIVIEDSTNGIIAAKEAGIFCVGYRGPNSSNQDFSRADLVVTDFKEIAYDRLIGILENNQ